MSLRNYTPQQIEEILQAFFDVAGTRQYIGARYVPQFGRRGESSIEWDDSAPYEPLTIVIHEGNSYTSRTYVPTGVDIANQTYWALTGAYNAQVEAYRQEVIHLQEDWVDWKTDTEGDISDWKMDTLGDLDDWKEETVDDFEEAIGNLPTYLPSSSFSATKTVEDKIAKRVLLIIGDSWSANNEWANRVKAANVIYDYVNLALNGAGFVQNSPLDTTGLKGTFQKQANNAISFVEDAGYSASDITDVIIYGCVNDYITGQSAVNVANAITTLLRKVKGDFTRANVYTMLNCAKQSNGVNAIYHGTQDYSIDMTAFPNWVGKIKQYLYSLTPHVHIITDSIHLLEYVPVNTSTQVLSVWDDDLLHPNATGQGLIASVFSKLLLTGQFDYTVSTNLVRTINNNHYTEYLSIVTENGRTSANIKIVPNTPNDPTTLIPASNYSFFVGYESFNYFVAKVFGFDDYPNQFIAPCYAQLRLNSFQLNSETEEYTIKNAIYLTVPAFLRIPPNTPEKLQIGINWDKDKYELSDYIADRYTDEVFYVDYMQISCDYKYI